MNKLQLSDHKKVVNFDFDWLTSGRPDQVKSSMFAFFVSANVAKPVFKAVHTVNKFVIVMWAEVN